MTIRPIQPHLRDQEARRRIQTALDETLFVEAGAGTGKTKALVDRVVALVLNGTPIERIIAITFTERAAAELSDRVRSGLEEKRDQEPGLADVIDTALASLDRAQISTIHAFGQALLHRYAAEAQIDPSFEVQDEVMAERRFQERWRIYLDSLGSDGHARTAIDRVLALGLTTGQIELLAKDLNERQELVPLLDRKLPPAPEPQWPDFDDLQARVVDCIEKCTSDGDRLCQKLTELLAVVASVARSHEEEREVALTISVGVLPNKYTTGMGNKENWGGTGGKDEILAEANEIAAQLRETLAGLRSSALRTLMPWIVRFVKEDALKRGRDGTLTFDDLIIRVRDLLRDSEDAARMLRATYDAMLIDEFQDTDPLQVDIARSFATDPDTGLLEPGRLFVVGDPKQSIYRFRRADMAVYSQAKQMVEADHGAFPRLGLNQRSRSTVLDWVNPVFEKLIGDGSEPDIQPEYAPIDWVRDVALAGPGVAWMGAEEDALARETREHEAEAIAAQCLAAAREGWQVYERPTKTVRPAQLRDIAILIPTRGILPALERALPAAGIPYRVEGGSLVYRTQEVRDLTNCLTAIDDPADEVAVVAALRSPAFACSDVDLARFKAAGGRFDYLASNLAEREGPVAEALGALAEYHIHRHDGSLASLVERFTADRGLVETGMLDAGDRNSFRRVRFMIEQARNFEGGGPSSLRAFIKWTENRSTGLIRDNEAASLDDEEDAVRIMTIHSAKGLEFPIVFVAGLSWYAQARPKTYAVNWATDEVAVCIGYAGSQFTLGDVASLNQREQQHEDAEYARRMYVAATRAGDHLIVSLYHGKRAPKNCGAKRLIDAGARGLATELPTQPVIRRDQQPFADLAVERADEPPEQFARTRTQLVTSAARRKFTSATALKGIAEAAREDEGEPWARGRGGTRLGRAVHAAIQSLPWDAGEETIAAYARAEAVAEAIPDRAAEVARFVRRALQSEAADRARSAKRALREVPFGAVLDGRTVEGFIDLLIEGPDGIEIVDWKTDQISASDVEQRLETYKLQAGLYVIGIEAATGRRVARVTYVFTGPEVERSPGDPRELAEFAKLQLEASA